MDIKFDQIRVDSHYASRFRSVTVPSPFRHRSISVRQNSPCSHCPSWGMKAWNNWYKVWSNKGRFTLRHVSVPSPFHLRSVRMVSVHTVRREAWKCGEMDIKFDQIKADSNYASRFRSVTVPSPFRHLSISVPSPFNLRSVTVPSAFRHCSISVPSLFHLRSVRMISIHTFQKSTRSNMQPTATECVFRYLLIIRTSVITEWY